MRYVNIMVPFVRISPASCRHLLAGTNSSSDASRCLASLRAYSNINQCQETCKTTHLEKHVTSAKSLKYWNGLQCQTRGLFGQCRTGGLAVLKQALKPGVSNTCWVPSAGYCDVPSSYVPPQDDTGVTYIHDLGQQDAAIVQQIAYQELKALLDKFRIPYHKRKGMKDHKFQQLYGSSLASIVEHDIKMGKKFGPFLSPCFLTEMILYLDSVEGDDVRGEMFNPSGVDTNAFKKDANDNYYSGRFRLDKYEPQVIAAALVRFLSELPEKMTSVDRLEEFPPVAGLKNIHRLQVLNYMYLMMRREHQDTIQAICYLCYRELMTCYPDLSEHKQDEGDRPSVQVATKLKDVLHTPGKFQGDGEDRLKNSILIGRLYMDYMDKLWTPWTSKDKFDGVQAKPDESVRGLKKAEIIVKAPHLPKKEGPVQINEKTTAIDVVCHFETKVKMMKELSDSRYSPKSLEFCHKRFSYLHEKGGNIGSRRIDPWAKVLDVYKINPKAEFVIEPRFGR
ncbi:rho GTPase-activating protein 18-like isoform X2 [Physella acuta]|uniref:rho GTPase-activating protein 18-like isoform X2 n=1 Tax=Physella acuta TaxID=109671 RepID=UPI0027DC7BD8|nr:rho GTPase-activating protein 18-like isoform X2 [Physella acuta]